MNKDREVWCVRLKLGSIESRIPELCFLVSCLKDPGEGALLQNRLLCREMYPREEGAILITINNQSQENTESPPGPRRSHGQDLRSFQLRGFRRSTQDGGPAFLRHSPTPAPSGMCHFYLVLWLTGPWNSKAERDRYVGSWVGLGLEQAWEYYVFRKRAPSTLPLPKLVCPDLLVVLVDYMLNWPISRTRRD